MRFLKTLQKHELERPTAGEDLTASEALEREGANMPAGLLAVPDLRIGSPRIEAPVPAVPGPAPVMNGGRLEPAAEDMTTAERPSVIREAFINVERVNPRLVAVTQPRSPYCEEYRNLRTQIIHKSKRRKLQAMVISSVGPSEGKSVTALNLSWLFAQTDGIKALVIDSDLRRPSLAEYLGFDVNAPGLSDLLIGGALLMDNVIRLQPAGLFILPGGSARDDVAELLSGPRFAEILKEARSYFDYIIIDAPPLGIFTDASLLINLADGAMLVVRAGHTRYKDVDRILETLPRERMLGTILNQSDEPLMDESYYRYGFYERNEP